MAAEQDAYGTCFRRFGQLRANNTVATHAAEGHEMHLALGRIALRQVNVAVHLVVPVAGREADQRTKRYETVEQNVQFEVLHRHITKVLTGVVSALVLQTHNKASARLPNDVSDRFGSVAVLE